MVILCSEQFGGSSYCLNAAKFRDTAPLTARKLGASCSHLSYIQSKSRQLHSRLFFVVGELKQRRRRR